MTTTGCYTCRLRRKKCDEGSPCCTACKNLGLRCDYKRPMWWSNNDQRRHEKDDIKMIIKRKATRRHRKLSHPAPTPHQDCHTRWQPRHFSDSIDRTRSASIDSQFSLDFDFNGGPAIADYTAYNAQMHSSHSQFAPPLYSEYTPYEVDVKTERQTFVNDGLTRRESTISTYSTYHAPPDAMLPSFPIEGGEFVEEIYGERRESFGEEALDINLFDFSNGSRSTPTMHNWRE